MMPHTDILIVGGGPAGLAAAAAASGKSVVVLDDNPNLGGQIWREGVEPDHERHDAVRQQAIALVRQSGASVRTGRRVIDAPSPGVLRMIAEDAETSSIETIHYDRLILATGARERFLPFPGWTLPGVFGAGGLQALVKGGFSVAGKRVVVAGTGPLLMAVAAHLKADGAEIVFVAEQAPLGRLLPFALSLLIHAAKLVQGARYRATLAGVPYRTGCWPTAVLGDGGVTGVELTDGSRRWTEACDLLACGFHLVPNTELATLLGCRIDGQCVTVDVDQRTSVPGVYCVGEPTGIAGLDAAMLQGRIAGLHAAERLTDARLLHRKRDRERTFGLRLDRAFALRPEVLRLAAVDTVVCRCEDVRYGQLERQHSWTDAKLQTRCGMGPCQGRICGPSTQALFGWQNASIRPPLFPVPLSALCSGPAPSVSQVQLQEETP